jgi:hypothetical protein
MDIVKSKSRKVIQANRSLALMIEQLRKITPYLQPATALAIGALCLASGSYELTQKYPGSLTLGIIGEAYGAVAVCASCYRIGRNLQATGQLREASERLTQLEIDLKGDYLK